MMSARSAASMTQLPSASPGVLQPSLSTIVIVAVGVRRTALVAIESSTVKNSSGSISPSSTRGTSIVVDVEPGTMVAVPLTSV
jgi:hypothetical protein